MHRLRNEEGSGVIQTLKLFSSPCRVRANQITAFTNHYIPSMVLNHSYCGNEQVDVREYRIGSNCRCCTFGYSELFPEQKEVICSFVAGHDVFVSLPTGLRKSLCFGMLPS